MNKELIKNSISNILQAIGEDTSDNRLTATPERVASSYQELFSGVNKRLSDLSINKFQAGNSNLVLLQDIKFFSMCEHHLLPIEGIIDIAYYPNEQGDILGFGDVIKIIELYAKRPQLQERLNHQIIEAVQEIINAQGVIARVKAKHMCMRMRSYKRDSSITTIASTGVFNTVEQRSYFTSLL